MGLVDTSKGSANNKGVKRLTPLKNLTNVINTLKTVTNNISARSLADESKPDEVLIHIHRIAHQQFQWQQDRTEIDLFRYLILYSDSTLNSMVYKTIGMDIYDLIFSTFDVLSQLKRNPVFAANVLNKPRSGESHVIYLQRFSDSLENLVESAKESQRYDDTWEYTWNPLEGRPLIQLSRRDQKYFCPIPSFLVRRVSQGLFYDLCNVPGFDNAMGKAFENYIGVNLSIAFRETDYRVHKQSPFYVGKKRHDGIDWLVEGPDANLFIECKCKRLTLSGKVLPDLDSIKKDLEVMASAVIQTYKNMKLAESGQSTWPPNGRPSFPLIVTLEDWSLLAPPVHHELTKMIEDKLAVEDLPLDIHKERPYTIISSRHFDLHCQNFAEIGIHKLFIKFTEKKYLGWDIEGFLRSEFSSYKPLGLKNIIDDRVSVAMAILKERYTTVPKQKI